MSSKKILVAMSAFKGSLTNEEACEAAGRGLTSLGLEPILFPVGDGGLGTAQAIFLKCGGTWEPLEVTGADGKPVTVQILHTEKGIFLEGAQAFGHHLMPKENRDPMRATSRGLGEMILHVTKTKPNVPIFVGLGDSAVSDVGIGMLSVLGVHFYDRSGKELEPFADSLVSIKSFTHIEHIPSLTVLCDVGNPLCGFQGSARIFSPQKGASPDQVALLIKGMDNIERIIRETIGLEVANIPMGGSAGGAATALSTFLGGKLLRGAPTLLDWIGFDAELLNNTDAVLVGEGTTDSQTVSGKAPFECLTRSKQRKIPGHVISGALGEGHEKLPAKSFHACGAEPSPREALQNKVREVFGNLLVNWT